MKMTLLALAALASLSATGAQASETKLDNKALVDLAKSGQVLCGGWRLSDASCEDLGFMDFVDADKVRLTYRFRLSLQPDLEVVMVETSTIENGALCSVFDFETLQVAVLLDGEVAPDEEGQGVNKLLAETYAQFAGKKSCETYLKDTVTGELSTQVTVDGERNPDLESQYRVLAPGDRIHLRPQDSGPDLSRQDI